MNWGSAASGFAQGFQNGNAMREQKKQRELQEAMQQARLEDMIKQRALQEEMQKQNFANLTKRQDWQESLDEYDRQYRIDRDMKLDDRYAGQQAFAKQQWQTEQGLASRALSDKKQDAIMGQLGDALNQARANRLNAARIGEIGARTAAIASGRMSPMGYQQTTEEDPLTGNKTITKMPLVPGMSPIGGVPSGGTAPALPAGVQQQLTQQMGANEAELLRRGYRKDPTTGKWVR